MQKGSDGMMDHCLPQTHVHHHHDGDDGGDDDEDDGGDGGGLRWR